MNRFWAKVEIGESEDCWEWQAGTVPYGYGTFGWRGGMVAHRAAWILTRGEIPNGLCVLHKCDNPPCVNPSHLFLGTRTDNVADMINKNRQRAVPQLGEKNGCAKLTADKVIEIRRLYQRGVVTQTMLALKYSVDRGTVKDILRGKIWKHIGGSVTAESIGHPTANFSTQDAVDLYMKGVDCKRIAQKLGGSFSSVHRRLKPLGILRTRGSGMQLRRIRQSF